MEGIGVSDIRDMIGDEVQRLKAENAALRIELKETRQTTQQYLQNVAHQLTAPLGAIKWSIEGIKDETISIPRKLKLLSSVYSQATILVHLIKNFALMSNLEADHELGQFREKPEAVDIYRLAINLANDFQPQAAEKGNKIIVDEITFDTVLTGRAVLMVKNLVAQALSNLLENAVKYADLRTTIFVSAEMFTVQADAPQSFAVRVSSIGLPISPAEAPKLCDRSFRSDSAKKKVPAGTGIGLYLAKRVMTLHQGTIAVLTKGNESAFLLVFPKERLSHEIHPVRR